MSPPNGTPVATATAAAPAEQPGPALQSASPGWILLAGAGSTPTPRLWQWSLTGQSQGLETDRDTLVISHGWLGSDVSSAPGDPSGFNPAFTALAQAAALAGRQVLFLDWGEQAIDPSPSGFAPYNAAGRINAVALWARDQLQPLADSGRLLSLAGHSLGSYVAAQTAALLGSGPNLRVQALDPAAAGLNGPYDLNLSNGIADPVPAFASVAPAGSLAFVVADINLSIGIAGNNAQAATAARSFVVTGFASGTSAATAHGAIPALLADLTRYLPADSLTCERILGSFRPDQYNDSGGTSGSRSHEGVVTLRSNAGALQRIQGFSANGLSQTVHFVDSSDSSTPSGSSASRDTLVSRRSVQLRSAASVEEIVLTGADGLEARGNGNSQLLIGNLAGNRLSGQGGSDTLCGGGENDTLSGGAGADSFLFDSPLNSNNNVDQISDFSIAQADRIQLENSGNGLFNALLTTGGLAATAFIRGAAFTSTDQRIRYDNSNGQLFYDPDGSGVQGQILFATLSTGLSLNNTHFVVT